MTYEELKPKWIAALRSGLYKQGHNRLFDDESKTYCCLGIAGVICGVSITNLTNKGVYCDSHNKTDKVPKEIYGNATVDGQEFNRFVHELTEQNDFKNKSFSEIADFIESYKFDENT